MNTTSERYTAWMRRHVVYKGVDGRREGERIITEHKVYEDDIQLTSDDVVLPAEKTEADYEHVERFNGPDPYSVGHMDGWNDCLEAISASPCQSTRIATLEAEVGRYREALENFARNAPTQSLADIARNALKED